jgi:D,D-heptose 1,7-bisphosphate phosphatase
MNPTKKVVILAGGKGTRLKSVLGDKPKPLATVAGRTLLERQIDMAVEQGVDEVHLLVHHLADPIRDHIGNGDKWGIQVFYHVEGEPRGTAGCVLEAMDKLPDRFLVFYGDTLMKIDLERIWQTHVHRNADATLFLHPNNHPYDSDLIELNDQNLITAFHGVPHNEDQYLGNLVNAALYIVEKKSLEPWSDSTEKLDFARDLFPRMVKAGGTLIGYKSREYIKDMGTPDRIAQGEKDLASGKVDRLAIDNPAVAIFLDRDGTLNVECDRISDPEKLELIDGAAEACKLINESGNLAVVATNQAVVARGDCTVEGLTTIHNKLETLLGRERAYVDSIYYCPHHPHSGFEGEIPELKIKCECRKPAAGMLFTAAQELNIDLNESWMIGDTTRDAAAGNLAGVRSVMLRTGYGGRDYTCSTRADYEFYDLLEATKFILQDFEPLKAAATKYMCGLGDQRILLIGGRSRSGKSTWASLCQEALRLSGRTAHVVCIDGWIKPVESRGTNVMSRFDLDSFVQELESVTSRTETVKWKLPVYDRQTRQIVRDKGPVLSVKPEDLLIVEGVIALAAPQLNQFVAGSFFVECDPSTYSARFSKEYTKRGMSHSEIEQLSDERAQDELPIVDGSLSHAEFKINLERIVGEY